MHHIDKVRDSTKGPKVDVCRAFLNACFGRFKVGLKDLTLLYVRIVQSQSNYCIYLTSKDCQNRLYQSKVSQKKISLPFSRDFCSNFKTFNSNGITVWSSWLIGILQNLVKPIASRTFLSVTKCVQ